MEKKNTIKQHLIILVVDDSKVVIDRLVPAIKELSNVAEVLYGQTCEEGEKIFRENKIDVAVLDINLPDRSGVELLKKIKAAKLTVKVVVIMMTDEPTERKKELCISSGADYFIDKFEGFEKIINIIGNISWNGSLKKEDKSSDGEDEEDSDERQFA